MKTKKENHAIDKRIVRSREKRAVKNGIDYPIAKMTGRVCRLSWGANRVNTRTNEIDIP